jgi:hypothetical protein
MRILMEHADKIWLSSKKVAGPVAKGLRLGTLSVVARHVRAKRVGDGR